MSLKENLNTPKYWDGEFQKEFEILEKDHHSYPSAGYRWSGIRFEIISRPIPFKGKLLDVGCGLGHFCRCMKARNPKLEIYGTDFSPKAIKIAQKIEPDINYSVANARELPFPDDCFDIVSAQEIIEHLDSQEEVIKAIREWRRVLKKGGWLYITTPWNGAGRLLYGDRFGGKISQEHIYEWTPQELGEEMKKIFKDVNITYPPALTDLMTKKTDIVWWFMVGCQK